MSTAMKRHGLVRGVGPAIRASLVSAAVAASVLAHAQGLAGDGAATPTPTPTPPTSVATTPATVLGRAAHAIGIRRCAGAIDAVASRAFVNAQRQDVVLDWDRSNPDGAPFFSLSGIEYRESSAILSLTTSPALQGGCTILAERISSAPLACREVARAELTGYQAAALVRGVTVYVDPHHSRETVTLVEAPPSCVIVRRQVQFSWGVSR
ncbi:MULTISPECIES: hypothetical protein [Burkholderia cepacia complex]|uniref:Uncharacterized protein n=2 Tax=Burkholderia cepacia complex TaxID=87882 RepID=A0A1B4LHJ8_9BURK|nr:MULTISPECIES: hypothetical protein [Burkholderia cepacia complex]AOJ76681.1 hypothetical protein WJ35_16470 [Burkholderia ubonensis]AOK13769.1 hypothetical protein WK31_25925 [Burkholderia vietnamiensis]KVF14425.1 hypothetical protein WJ05_07955 [Burkholderia vietnamiensis]KVF26412.1 hypothetical protein WJ08_26875 [Burkholderia vietnamiensis]KVF41696.1 hypothetical protein WJ10_13645 [Burkholderia vietnamiensis]